MTEPELMEPPEVSTFCGFTGYEWHALWYGFLDTWGRFHSLQLTPDEKVHAYQEKKHYFWAGKVMGSTFRGLIGAIVVFLSTGSVHGALISAFVLVTGDQVAGGNGQ